MVKYRFLITGVGHTGTGWAARAMNLLGHSCGHEWVYNFHGAPVWANLHGEASWPAAAVLDEVPRPTPIIHLTRHPLLIVGSAHIAGFTADENLDSPYMSMVRSTLPEIDLLDTSIDRAMAWVVLWSRMIERGVVDRFTKRFKIEDISSDPEALSAMALACTGVVPRREDVLDVLRIIPGDFNTHVGSEQRLGWDDLPDGVWRQRLIELCADYGYDT